MVEKFGVHPESIPDYLALVGDTADGVPGLPGWGAKSTATVLARYPRLELIPPSAADWEVTVRSAEKLAATLASTPGRGPPLSRADHPPFRRAHRRRAWPTWSGRACPGNDSRSSAPRWARRPMGSGCTGGRLNAGRLSEGLALERSPGRPASVRPRCPASMSIHSRLASLTDGRSRPEFKRLLLGPRCRR